MRWVARPVVVVGVQGPISGGAGAGCEGTRRSGGSRLPTDAASFPEKSQKMRAEREREQIGLRVYGRMELTERNQSMLSLCLRVLLSIYMPKQKVLFQSAQSVARPSRPLSTRVPCTPTHFPQPLTLTNGSHHHHYQTTTLNARPSTQSNPITGSRAGTWPAGATPGPWSRSHRVGAAGRPDRRKAP